MTRALITVIERATSLHIVLEDGGDPVRVGEALASMTQRTAPSSPLPLGAWSAKFTQLLMNMPRPQGNGLSRILVDPAQAGAVPFHYEIDPHAKALRIRVTEFAAKNGAGADATKAKTVFDGDLPAYLQAFKLSSAATAEQVYLVEVASTAKDVYHRVFRASEAEAARLHAIISGLTKAKVLRAGKVLALHEYVPEFNVDDLIAQLTDLCGEAAVRKVAAKSGKSK